MKFKITPCEGTWENFLVDSGILVFGIRNPISTAKDYRIQFLESTACNPESNTVLDSLTCPGARKGGDLPQDKGQHRNTDLHSVFEAFSFYGCLVLKHPELV